MAESYKLDELTYHAANSSKKNTIWFAHANHVVVWKLRQNDGRFLYTIAHQMHPTKAWFVLEPLAAQCVLYHLLGNPEGNQ
ncbi:MAG: hypothetical protein ACXVCO_10085 [Ktedonobacterales bacterium]